MKKNILMVSTGDVVGGVGRVMSDLEGVLSRKGCEVNLIVGKKHSNNPNVYQLSRNRFLEKLGRKFNKDMVSIFRYLRNYFLANDLIFGASNELLNHSFYEKADVVHLHNIHGSYLKIDVLSQIAKAKPVVWTLHDKWAITAHCAHCFDCKADNNGKHFTPGRNRYGSDMLWNNSDHLWNKKREIYSDSPNLYIVSPSQWLAGYVKKSILKDKHLAVINNGVDTSIFKPLDKTKLRKKYKLRLNDFIVGYVGHWGGLEHKKGSEYFLSTSRHYRDNNTVKFLCIGGKRSGTIEKSENVYFTKNTHDRHVIAEYYSVCDILLYASLAENFPLTVLEALSCGLPVVAFDVGGVKEQIEHKKNGYIAKYEDLKDLIRGVEYIRGMGDSEIKQMKDANRKRAVKYYSIEEMSQNYEKLYEQIS